jgi:hypothetical protein
MLVMLNMERVDEQTKLNDFKRKVLLEKLIATQMGNKSPSFYGTCRFIPFLKELASRLCSQRVEYSPHIHTLFL